VTMISYADLEKAFRAERTYPQLQKLPPSFYDDVKKLSQSPDIGEYSSTVRDYLEKIYNMRLNKVIHYAGRALNESKPPENALPNELSLYNKLLSDVAENRVKVLEKKMMEETVEETNLVKVRIKKPLPAIVGSDSSEYGPFRVDDVVELPEDSARLLIQRDAAENI